MREKFPNSADVAALSFIALLIVLAVLILTPKFYSPSGQARITAAKSQMSILETALDAFQVDCGRYPSMTEGQRPLLDCPKGLQGWRGPYLMKPAYKDPWGNPYCYVVPGVHNNQAYDLFSAGPDGRFGTKDDITNWDEDDGR